MIYFDVTKAARSGHSSGLQRVSARLREVLPDARYEPGRAQVSLKVPLEPADRLPTVVRAADGLLAAVRAAA